MEKQAETKYSVLMSVYKNENPYFFEQSIESILNQTIKTNDFVIVCDGPLTDELNSVLDKYLSKFPDFINVVRLSANGGLGNALNIGLKHCKNDLVARMDSDDISKKDRCERELNIFQSMEVDIVSGTIAEFEENPDNISCLKVLPEKHEDILKFYKKRCPFNHPCVMYRKQSVINAGGYQDCYHFEDYYLWARMINNGCIGYNIQDVLLSMRASKDMYKRRGGFKYFKSQKKFLQYMCEKRIISRFEYIKLVVIRFISSMMPTRLRMFFYHKFLRKGVIK